MSEPGEVCQTCRKLVLAYVMCDRQPDGIWCLECWPDTECARSHSEGCSTRVFETQTEES